MAAVTWQETCGAAQASYRLMAQALLTNMIAAGFVQTSDAGQVNPSTIVVATTSGTGGTFGDDYGYLMFRMNDSLSATLPVYIKFIFGSYFPSTSSARRCAMRIIFGFATDGAGNFTGPTKEVVSSGAGGTYSNIGLPGPHSSWCHHKEGLAALFAYRAYFQTSNPGSNTMINPMAWFVVERTRDSSGNPTAEGIYIFHRGTLPADSSLGDQNVLSLSSNTYTPQPHTTFMSPSVTKVSKFGALWLGENYTNSKSGAVQLQDIWAPHNGGTPFKSVKLYKNSMAAVGDTTNFTQDGVTKPFIMLGSWAIASDLSITDGADVTTAYQRIGLALEWAA